MAMLATGVIVCDEAHLYLPSSAASTGPARKRALENFERIAKGRKYGVGLMVVSQRPSDVSTTILSQCSNIISLRLANKTDQSVVKQLLPESLEGLMEVLPTLDVGEAVVVGDATYCRPASRCRNRNTSRAVNDPILDTLGRAQGRN